MQVLLSPAQEGVKQLRQYFSYEDFLTSLDRATAALRPEDKVPRAHFRPSWDLGFSAQTLEVRS